MTESPHFRMTIPQASPHSRSTTAAAHNSIKTNVKAELEEEVSHLSLSTPTQELRRSPRTRTSISFKGESDGGEMLMRSKFWSSSTGSSRKRTGASAYTKGEDGDVLPTVSDSANQASRKRKKTANGISPRLKRIKREYAPPEAYAHLEFLDDYLTDHLDGTYHRLGTFTPVHVAKSFT